MILAVGRMGSAAEIKKEVSGMISFLLCLAILIGGYFVYGKIVDNTFGPDDRETPAVRINSLLHDGIVKLIKPATSKNDALFANCLIFIYSYF